MAFQQPNRPRSRPQNPIQTQQQPQEGSHAVALVSEGPREWLLFNAPSASLMDGVYTTANRTGTISLSYPSDVGSLQTSTGESGDEERNTSGQEHSVGGFDSLDADLKEFGQASSTHREEGVEKLGNSILPRHDGLGAFEVGGNEMGRIVQEHLFAFERYNRGAKRRWQSTEPKNMEEEERTRRIEAWRFEQSKVLDDKIRMETRGSELSASPGGRATLGGSEDHVMATFDDIKDKGIDIQSEQNGFWRTVMRIIISDWMGVDEEMLSILFGEKVSRGNTSTTVLSHSSMSHETLYFEDLWKQRLITRLARELGHLANKLSHHPGAFSTYLHIQTPPIAYAGLPPTSESAQGSRTPFPTSSAPEHSATTPGLDFQPTLQSLPSAPTSPASTSSQAPVQGIDAPLTEEEWERDIDVTLIFRYFRSRLTSRKPTLHCQVNPSSQPTHVPTRTHSTSHLAMSNTTAAAARAAAIRPQHPLARITGAARRREMHDSVWKGSTRCGSERRLALGTIKEGMDSVSSRNYWDLDGSSMAGGSGSLVSISGTSSWGDV